MTVAELIAKLQAFDPNTPVAVMAYEAGLTARLVVAERVVSSNDDADREFWEGELEIADTGTPVVALEREGGHRWG